MEEHLSALSGLKSFWKDGYLLASKTPINMCMCEGGGRWGGAMHCKNSLLILLNYIALTWQNVAYLFHIGYGSPATVSAVQVLRESGWMIDTRWLVSKFFHWVRFGYFVPYSKRTNAHMKVHRCIWVRWHNVPALVSSPTRLSQSPSSVGFIMPLNPWSAITKTRQHKGGLTEAEAALCDTAEKVLTLPLSFFHKGQWHSARCERYLSLGGRSIKPFYLTRWPNGCQRVSRCLSFEEVRGSHCSFLSTRVL